MDKIRVLFLLIFFYWLVACTPQETMMPTDNPTAEIYISTVEPISTSTKAPIPTATLVESVFSISKIHEWKAYYPITWFKKDEKFAILLKTSLDVYDSSLNLIWSTPKDSAQLDSILEISPDDKTIALYDSYQTGVILLDSSSGKQEIASGQDNCMIQVTADNMLFTLNNRLIIGFNGELDKGNRPIQISAWNISPLSCFGKKIAIPVQEGEPSFIYAMKTSLDGKYFVSISTHIYHEYQGIIRVWDTKNLSQICEMPGIYASFRPSNGLLAVISKGGDTLSYFDVEKCTTVQTLKLPAYTQEQEMDFTPDGKYLIFLRHGFQIMDATNGKLLFDDKSDIFGGFGVLKISPDGKYLLSIHADHGPVTALWKLDYTQSP